MVEVRSLGPRRLPRAARPETWWVEILSGFGLLLWAALAIGNLAAYEVAPSGSALMDVLPVRIWAVLAAIVAAVQMLAAFGLRRWPRWLAALPAGTFWLLFAEAIGTNPHAGPVPAAYLAFVGANLVTVFRLLRSVP